MRVVCDTQDDRCDVFVKTIWQNKRVLEQRARSPPRRCAKAKGTIDMRQIILDLGQYYDQYGYLLVFGGAFLENMAITGIVLPGGALAFAGAFYARQGTLSLPWVMVFAAVGALAGCHIDFWMGRWVLAQGITRWETTWWGKRLRLRQRLTEAQLLLDHYGGIALAIGPFLGVVRSFILLNAGALQMPYQRFIRWTAPAIAVWNSLWCLLGYFVGSQYGQIQRFVAFVGWGIVALIALAVIGWRIGKARVWPRLSNRMNSSGNH